jgi:hypothetical protein
MKYLYTTCLLIVFLVLNCDGRKSQNEALKTSIAQFKAKAIIQNTYIPKTYHEIVTDSSLSNGFKTQVTLYTNMNIHMVRTVKRDKILNQVNYRSIQGEVTVWFKENVIFDKIIDKTLLKKELAIPENDLNAYNLAGIWIDQSYPLDNDLLRLDIEYRHIDHNTSKSYKLLISEKGNFRLIGT